MRQFSVRYIFLFSAAVCGVCAVLVSSAAVSLSERQEVNEILEKRKNVLEAAGLVETGASVTREEIDRLFEGVEAVVVDLESGMPVEDVDPATFDQQAAKKDPDQSRAAPSNPSLIQRLPLRATVYQILGDGGAVEKIVLPVEGYGLWGTLYGFLALDSDTKTVEGITFYQHKETPGLGGEVDNPRWKALWPGREVFDENWDPEIAVVKGAAPPPAEAPHKVDGLSGATITSRGVGNLLTFWLGPDGFGPYLENLRTSKIERRAA